VPLQQDADLSSVGGKSARKAIATGRITILMDGKIDPARGDSKVQNMPNLATQLGRPARQKRAKTAARVAGAPRDGGQAALTPSSISVALMPAVMHFRRRRRVWSSRAEMSMQMAVATI